MQTLVRKRWYITLLIGNKMALRQKVLQKICLLYENKSFI